jgi:hypothetical protein
MAVEDDYSTQQNRQQGGSSLATPSHVSNPQIRAPPPMPQSRAPYNTYPQADYGGYYSNPPGRESYMEYPYGYDAYRGTSDPSLYPSPGMSSTSPQSLYPGIAPQNLHPSSVADMHRQQPGLFYDYGAASRPPGSQFYYASHQAMMYPPTHSPMMTTQLGTSNPATLADKKRELQVCRRISFGTSLNLTVLLYSTIFSSKLPLRISCTRLCGLHHHHIRLSPLLLTMDPKYR